MNHDLNLRSKMRLALPFVRGVSMNLQAMLCQVLPPDITLALQLYAVPCSKRLGFDPSLTNPSMFSFETLYLSNTFNYFSSVL